MFSNERGFTLLEMLIVLLIITVLILLIVPNISDRSSNVHDKGCDALVLTVQSQTDAYRLENGSYPSSINILEAEGFITENQMSCENNKELQINEGVVNLKGE